jgi:hypothetical protein
MNFIHEHLMHVRARENTGSLVPCGSWCGTHSESNCIRVPTAGVNPELRCYSLDDEPELPLVLKWKQKGKKETFQAPLAGNGDRRLTQYTFRRDGMMLKYFNLAPST